MLIEESLIVDIADMSCVRNDNQGHIVTAVLDGLLHLRMEEFVILSHQIESRYGNVFIEKFLDILAHTVTELDPVQEAVKGYLLRIVKKQSLRLCVFLLRDDTFGNHLLDQGVRDETLEGRSQSKQGADFGIEMGYSSGENHTRNLMRIMLCNDTHYDRTQRQTDEMPFLDFQMIHYLHNLFSSLGEIESPAE